MKRQKQQGRAIERILGDHGQILFPDGGARPLNIRIRKFQNKPGDGYGSHMSGRHKLG